MSGDRFDELLRDKLAAARHEGQPDWDGLRSQLDGADFDATLARGLGGATVATSASGAVLPEWERLSAKLDADAEVSGDAFDAIISRRVARATSDEAPAASWRQLSHRIDTLWPLRRRLVRYRVLEMAAVALLLITFAPLLHDYYMASGGGEAVLAESQRRDGGDSVLGGTAAAVRNDGSTALSGSEAGATDADADMVDRDGARYTTTATPTYSPLDNLLGALGLAEPVAVRSAEEIAALFAVPVTTPTVAADLVPAAREKAPVRGGHGKRVAGYVTRAALDLGAPTAATFSVLPDAVLARFPAPAVPQLSLPKLAAPENPWSFGASVTARTWSVATPSDPAFEQASATRQTRATQVGAHVLRDLAPRWRLGLSLGTASATYATGLPVVHRVAAVTPSGYDVSEDFRGIDLDVAQATLDARVGLLPAGRAVQIWAKAGLGANTFLRTAYDLRREDIDSRAAGSKPRPSGAEFVNAGPPVKRPFVPTEQKAFTEGLLQGGSLSDNTQFFGRVGLEAEVELGDRLRAFGAADYDAALSGQRGFGPNRDRFGGYGLEVGARISL